MASFRFFPARRYDGIRLCQPWTDHWPTEIGAPMVPCVGRARARVKAGCREGVWHGVVIPAPSRRPFPRAGRGRELEGAIVLKRRTVPNLAQIRRRLERSESGSSVRLSTDRPRLKRLRRSQEKSSTLATKTTPPIMRTQTRAERVPTKESTSKNRKAKRTSRIPIQALPPRRPMP